MNNLNFIISKKLTELRKKNRFTQLELAEKLNYSDKAVSKWENGESVPGIEVLYKLSKLYNVSLDYIVGEEEEKSPKAVSTKIKRKRIIITLLSIIAVWLSATVIYIFINIFSSEKIWILFCWACPVSLVVSLVFDVIWHERKYLFFIISCLLWSALVCFCLQFITYNIWMILGIGIPLQVATFLWARLYK